MYEYFNIINVKQKSIKPKTLTWYRLRYLRVWVRLADVRVVTAQKTKEA